MTPVETPSGVSDVVLGPAPRPIVSAARSRNLDVVRAVAALLVLTGHSYLLSGRYLDPTELRPDHLLITNMAAGVWLFFALSGFLIAAPYVDALVSAVPCPASAATCCGAPGGSTRCTWWPSSSPPWWLRPAP
jgi:hypothetical protein